MKKRILLLILAAITVLSPIPVYAFMIAPSSTPTIEQTDAYRNVLETGDLLIIIHENTPYTETPEPNYSDAFVWRLYDVDGTSELAQSTGNNYHNRGYGHNVISWYFSAADLSTLGIDSYPVYWELAYTIKLSGTSSNSTFDTPIPFYNLGGMDTSSATYSALTDTDEVKAEITTRILELAAVIDNRWGLAAEYSLLDETLTKTVLSLYGQAFFRRAIYGIQAMAPELFDISITNIDVEDRTWTTDYEVALEAQHAGSYLEDATSAGEALFDVSYNLMGMLIILGICLLLTIANWRIAGGNIWRGMVESGSVIVIGSRMALFGLGEVALIVAVCWLYISAKTWKVI